MYGKSTKEGKTLARKDGPAPTGSGAIEERGSEFVGGAEFRESYRHAMEEFIGWYCSEPRLSFSRTVVLRYRFFLEQRNLAPSTINVRLAAVRRLAYEASDPGLLSPELAAGTRRVKGAKRLGVRVGNWLTIEQARSLVQEQPSEAFEPSETGQFLRS